MSMNHVFFRVLVVLRSTFISVDFQIIQLSSNAFAKKKIEAKKATKQKFFAA